MAEAKVEPWKKTEESSETAVAPNFAATVIAITVLPTLMDAAMVSAKVEKKKSVQRLPMQLRRRRRRSFFLPACCPC